MRNILASVPERKNRPVDRYFDNIKAEEIKEKIKKGDKKQKSSKTKHSFDDYNHDQRGYDMDDYSGL